MFYDWMMERYLGKDTPRGDLADDMQRAGDFPRTDDRMVMLMYLEGKRACHEAVQLFKRAYLDYAKETGLPNSKHLCNPTVRRKEEKRAWSALLDLRLKEAEGI